MPAIDPKNLTAQLTYQAAGNPPSTLPGAAISNAAPGLEMDFRNAWRHLFEGIVLHEANNLVMDVAADAPANVRQLKLSYVLLSADGQPVTALVTGPLYVGGPNVPLPDNNYHDPTMPLEWSNALAGIVPQAGHYVPCRFRHLTTGDEIMVDLKVRHFFDQEIGPDGQVQRRAVIARSMVQPGDLTQSLCSPWQNDYRECACFYWAASRPDYVNIEPRPDGLSTGQNWMQKDRTPATPNFYIVDDWQDERLLTHEALFTDWEKSLLFVIGGQDVPLPTGAADEPTKPATRAGDTTNAPNQAPA
jgi:hypothetical protein